MRRAVWLAVASVGFSMVSLAAPTLTAAAATSHTPAVIRPDVRYTPGMATCTGPGDFGAQYLSSTWPGGFTGVPVYSDGSGYVSNCYNYVTTPSGKSVESGMEWQCVELVNRLYITKGWISATWTGDGDQLYGTASSVGLTNEQKQGSISSLAPGDVISFNGPIPGGHAAVVSNVSGSSITLVNQNTSSSNTLSTATLSNGSLVMNGWEGYKLIGVIHAPTSSPPGTLWGINTSGQAVRYAGNAKWTRQGGPAFKDIAATGSTVAALSIAGAVYTYTGNNTWHLVSGATLTDTAVQ